MNETNYPVIQSTPGDHDLLVRIDEQLKALRSDFIGERQSAIGRDSARGAEIAEIRRDVESLRVSRAQVYAIAATLSLLVSIALKLFWR